MAKQDTFHDYRPDPTFEIESHLTPGVPRTDDEFLPKSAKKAFGYLEGFHEKFVWGEPAAAPYEPKLRADVRKKAWMRLKPKDQWEKVEGKVPEHPNKEKDWEEVTWANAGKDKWEQWIATMRWDQLCRELLPELADVTFNAAGSGPDGKDPQTVNGQSMAKYQKYFPYFEQMIRLAGTWPELKKRLLEEFDTHKANKADPKNAESPGFTRDEGTKLMKGILNFRMAYDWDMLNTAREGGVKKAKPPLQVWMKAVGSADTTSDIDMTISGPDDVACITEVNRYFRAVWGRESLMSTDSMFYIRDWMTVTDSLNRENKKKPKPTAGDPHEPKMPDTSFQVQVLDVLGDIYALAKIRRYAWKEQWDAFVEATKRDVKVDGLAIADVPMFKRLDHADEVFQKQYVMPLWTRTAEERAAWEQEPNYKRFLKLYPDNVKTDKAHLLEGLQHWDRDIIVRASNLMYMELAAKARDDERAIFEDPKYKVTDEAKFFKWRQNDGPTLVTKPLPVNLAGFWALTERQSQLISEYALFASEAYNAQGTLWSIVGGQGGERPKNLTVEHFLQTFNEQIGDCLKELFEFFHEARLAHDTEEKEAAITTGMYRASKYEGRMAEVVRSLDKLLREHPSVKARIEARKKLFPGRLGPDDEDIGNLGHEAAVSEFYDEHIKELLNIRKLKGKYATQSAHDNVAAATKLIEDATAPQGKLHRVVIDPARDHGLLKYPPTSPFNIETDRDLKFEWGLRDLMHHLLSHAAIVNKLVRKILSRGPADIYVRSFAE